MPLSEPAPRERLHSRDIVLRGYQRTDGLFDIEAHLTDTKPFGFPSDDRGYVAAGEPLHQMWMRMTVDEALTIIACEAVTEHGPYAICPQAAPNFSRLAGLSIKRGFLRAAAERVGGVHGCTHLRELLQQMATVAYQTLYPVLMRREAQPAGKSARENGGAMPSLLNSCLAYAADGPLVKRRWPDHYADSDAAAPSG